MSAYTCSKCGKALEETGINPQIQRLKEAGITSMEGFPAIVVSDPYLYRGTYCTRCNKAFCPDCSHMQMQICPECGQQSLMAAYRPLLNKIAQTPAKSTIVIKEQSITQKAETTSTKKVDEQKKVGCWVWPVLVIGSLLFIASLCEILTVFIVGITPKTTEQTIGQYLVGVSCVVLLPFIIGSAMLGISIYTLRKSKQSSSLQSASGTVGPPSSTSNYESAKPAVSPLAAGEAVHKMKGETKMDFTRDEYGRTPLMVAVANKDEASLRRLLTEGVNVNEATPVKAGFLGGSHGGFTALHIAASTGNDAAIPLLIQYGADREAREAGSRMTPLLIAAFSGKEEAVLALVTCNVNVRATDAFGNTALNFSVQKKLERAATALEEEMK